MLWIAVDQVQEVLLWRVPSAPALELLARAPGAVGHVPREGCSWGAQWVLLCGSSQRVAHLGVLLLREPLVHDVFRDLLCNERRDLIILGALFLA